MNKYVVTLHIRNETDGREATLHFNDDKVAVIKDRDGTVLGHFRLVPEGLPDLLHPSSVGDGASCLAYCTIDEGNSLPYCLAICGAAAP